MYLNVENFKTQLLKLLPASYNKRFLLAISGGADSMVLAALFKDLNLDFEIAHVNYKLRGENSELDKELVDNFCRSNNIKFHLKTVSKADQKPENSIQVWARDIRYQFFKKIRSDRNLDYIVTAHHLNDDLETFIINLSRASGLKGLTGIPVHKNDILRPMLNFSKNDIYSFANENAVEFREDLSNLKSNYLRNQIRNEIVPQLMKIDETFLLNFSRSLSYLKESDAFIQEQILDIENEIITKENNVIIINKEKIFSLSQFLQFEILRKFGFNSTEEIFKIKTAPTGKSFQSEMCLLYVDRETLNINYLKLEAFISDRAEIELILDKTNAIILAENEYEEIKNLGNCDWEIDLDKIDLPLKLRQKTKGDVFYPVGMTGKKTVSKYYKDQKFPKLVQQKIWLLCDAKDEILGVLPFRQDRRFIKNKESKKINLHI